jgi:hypothetical protein
MSGPKSIIMPEFKIWSGGKTQIIDGLEVMLSSVKGSHLDATAYGGSLPVILAVYMAAYRLRDSVEGAREVLNQMNNSIDETATKTNPPFYLKTSLGCAIYHADNIIGNHLYEGINNKNDFVRALTGLPDLDELGEIVASSGSTLEMFKNIEHRNFHQIQFGRLNTIASPSIGLSIHRSSFKYRPMRLMQP